MKQRPSLDVKVVCQFAAVSVVSWNSVIPQVKGGVVHPEFKDDKFNPHSRLFLLPKNEPSAA